MKEHADPDEELPVGPLEHDVLAELEALGYNPLTPPGPLRSAARRAQLLAETYDRTQNAAVLPGLDRQIAAVLAECRQAAGPQLEVQGEERKPEEVSDFEQERKKRRPPQAGAQ